MKKYLSALLILFFISSFSFAQIIQHPPGQYVNVNGKKIWYETEGEGEPLLLIPGGPGNSHTYFHPWFSALSKKFKIIYYDAFGRGKSERAKSPEEYTFKHDVEEVEGLRKALGFKKWDVLGHSYGGMVVQQYAIRYPNSVNKLILMRHFLQR